MDMRTLVAATAFPLTIAAAITVMYFLPALGIPAQAVQALFFIMTIAGGHALERWMPFDPQWRISMEHG